MSGSLFAFPFRTALTPELLGDAICAHGVQVILLRPNRPLSEKERNDEQVRVDEISRSHDLPKIIVVPHGWDAFALNEVKRDNCG